MNFEQIQDINSRINTVDIKGKAYAQVNDRVLAFREICPEGRIESSIVYLKDGVCVIKATVSDENGNVLATGLAYENEGSTFINKTSYIENCETSAVGRALGFIGIGADGNICSAEELVNAVKNQNHIKKTEATAIVNRMESANIDSAKLISDRYGVENAQQLTYDQYDNLLALLAKKGIE